MSLPVLSSLGLSFAPSPCLVAVCMFQWRVFPVSLFFHFSFRLVHPSFFLLRSRRTAPVPESRSLFSRFAAVRIYVLVRPMPTRLQEPIASIILHYHAGQRLRLYSRREEGSGCEESFRHHRRERSDATVLPARASVLGHPEMGHLQTSIPFRGHFRAR